MLEIFSARKSNQHKIDDVVAEIDRLHQKHRKEIVIRKALHVVCTLLLGILLGYYGIKYQSVWVAFGIHTAWNLIMPFVVLLLILMGVLAEHSISSLWDRVRWRRRRSR